MDIHHRVVGVLHIVEATFIMLFFLMISSIFGVIATFAQIDAQTVAILTGIGSILIIPFLILSIAQIIAAIYLLRGSQNAKIWVMIFSFFSLFNFPLGTLLGVYTFWALLREQPPTAS